MQNSASKNHVDRPTFARWRVWWFALCLLTAMPAVYFTNQALLQTQLELDTRLIIEQKLWETDPAYAGSTRNWTRFAAWLLDREQLLERARALRPAQAESIEEEYNRDALLAYGGVILRCLAAWGLPFALAYAAGVLLERRRKLRSA